MRFSDMMNHLFSPLPDQFHTDPSHGIVPPNKMGTGLPQPPALQQRMPMQGGYPMGGSMPHQRKKFMMMVNSPNNAPAMSLPTPLGLRPRFRDESGKVFVWNDKGQKTYAFNTQDGSKPNQSVPDPKEFGLYPGQRAWHSNGQGRQYKIMDDGSHHYGKGGSYDPGAKKPGVQRPAPAVFTKPQPADTTAHVTPPPRPTVYQNVLPNLRVAQARLRQVGIWNINMPNAQGETPLMEALRRNDHQTAVALMSLNADIHALNPNGRNAAHYAAASGNLVVMKELLRKNPEFVKQRDHAGKDMFMCAVSFGQVASMNHLKDHYDIDIHARSNNGMTNLMWAAKNGQPSLEALLGMGANPSDMQTGSGSYAVDYAAAKRDHFSTPNDIAQARRNVEILRQVMDLPPEYTP